MGERFPEGKWVVQTRGPYAGSIGLIQAAHAAYVGKAAVVTKYVVQFGSGGPYRRLQHTSLRAATLEEIAQVNGCRVRDLTEADLR